MADAGGDIMAEVGDQAGGCIVECNRKESIDL